MVNILLDRYQLDADWLRPHLRPYLLPQHKVCVVAFSFRDNRVKCAADWQLLYGKAGSKLYSGIVSSLMAYGITEENIVFLDYFTDTKETAKAKVKQADVLYFLGGLPDRMYQRLEEFDLLNSMTKHNGVVIGYSAGAAIQLKEYHLSPDGDYPAFGYYPGLPYVDSMYLEVHYTGSDVQDKSIVRVLKEKHKPVYTTCETGGVIVENGRPRCIGDAQVFWPDIP